MASGIVSPSDFRKNAAGKVKRIKKVGLKDLQKRFKALDSVLYQQQKRKALEAEKYTSG